MAGLQAGVYYHDYFIGLILPQVGKRLAFGMQDVVAASAQRWQSLTQIVLVANGIVQIVIPNIEIPLEAFAAHRVAAAIQSNFIAIIDAVLTRIGQEE